MSMLAEFAEAMLGNQQKLLTITPAENIQIYQNNRIATLIYTLQETYSLILKLLGIDFFCQTAKEYIQKYPVRSGNLHEYGEYFSEFLAEHPALKNFIYLVEVAQLEWICHTLFVAADHPPFDMKKLTAVSADQFDQLHFTLNPASQLRQFHYPLLKIIDLCNGEIDGPLDVSQDSVNLLITRPKQDIRLIPLSHAEFTFLTTLQEDKTISEAMSLALQADAHFKLVEKISCWINDNIIVDFYL